VRRGCGRGQRREGGFGGGLRRITDKGQFMSKLQYLGTGIEVVNYPEQEISVTGEFNEETYDWISDEAEAKVKRITETIRRERGKFISGCIDIEKLLSDAISYFFFETDSEKRELFHLFLLDADTLSFKQKETLLKLIMEKFPKKFQRVTREKKQEMIESIDFLIKKRNAFAHGKIVINFETEKTELIFYDRSKNENVCLSLSPELFFELERKVINVCGMLWRLSPSSCGRSISLSSVKIDKLD
jgi:hypothetical protein